MKYFHKSDALVVETLQRLFWFVRIGASGVLLSLPTPKGKAVTVIIYVNNNK